MPSLFLAFGSVVNPPLPVVQGWVLEGIPQTRLQALSLQQAGIIPEHVGENIMSYSTLHTRRMTAYIHMCVCVCTVMLEAPDNVLLERTQGKLVDPLTGGEHIKYQVLPFVL